MIAVLGVDGGQSSIRLFHSSDPRVVEVDGVSRQEGDVVAAVANAVADGWRRLGSPLVDLAVLGLTTAPSDATANDRICALVAGSVGASAVWLADDAVTSHYGALSGGPGVSLICGTGVASMALPENGSPQVIGGHGYLLGDEGGGFWIGRRGLGAVLRASEGRGATTRLSDLARRRYGGLEDLHIRLHDADRPIDQIAQFAPDVLDAAADGDTVASDVLDEAVRELMSVAEAGLTWVGGDRVDLALGGRLLGSANELRARFERLLDATLPAARPLTAAASALEGAVALGRLSHAGPYAGLIHVWQAPGPTA